MRSRSTNARCCELVPVVECGDAKTTRLVEFARRSRTPDIHDDIIKEKTSVSASRAPELPGRAPTVESVSSVRVVCFQERVSV